VVADERQGLARLPLVAPRADVPGVVPLDVGVGVFAQPVLDFVAGVGLVVVAESRRSAR